MSWLRQLRPQSIRTPITIRLDVRRYLLVWAVTVLGLATVAITECLNVLHAFTFWPIATGWSIFLAASAIFLRRVKFVFPPRGDSDRITAAFLVCCLLIALLIGIDAFVSPPNTFDVLSYHLPRVLYWIQNRSLAVFPTAYDRQNFMPPFAEYIYLNLYVLTRGDRVLNMVQSFAFVVLLCIGSLVARELGAKARGQAVAALSIATISFVVLQASGAKNDVIFSVWLPATALFALHYAKFGSDSDIFGMAATFALAALTKGTALVIGPPLLLPAALRIFRDKRSLVRFCLILGMALILINGPFQLRIARRPGNRMGFHVNQRFGLRPTLSNMLRGSGHMMGSGIEFADRAVYTAVKAAHRLIHEDLNSPETTLIMNEFTTPADSRAESVAPDPVHFVLILLSLSVVGVAAIRKRCWLRLTYCAGLCLAFVAYCAVFRYSPHAPRLVMPVVTLAVTVAGLAAEDYLGTAPQIVLAAVLVWSVFPFLFQNALRPLAGTDSVLLTDRDANYYRTPPLVPIRNEYRRAEMFVLKRGCRDVGIDYKILYPLEYPLMQELLEASSRIRFYHPTPVLDTSAPYSKNACAIVCIYCSGDVGFEKRYRKLKSLDLGHNVVFYSDSFPANANENAPALH